MTARTFKQLPQTAIDPMHTPQPLNPEPECLTPKKIHILPVKTHFRTENPSPQPNAQGE